MAPRRRLERTRESVAHHFTITATADNGEEVVHDFYLHVGLYADGKPGELFITMKRGGGTSMGALMDAVAMACSVALQHGAGLQDLCSKFRGHKFYPAGPTNNPKIPRAQSPLDYLARWLADRFGAAAEAA